MAAVANDLFVYCGGSGGMGGSLERVEGEGVE